MKNEAGVTVGDIVETLPTLQKEQHESEAGIRWERPRQLGANDDDRTARQAGLYMENGECLIVWDVIFGLEEMSAEARCMSLWD